MPSDASALLDEPRPSESAVARPVSGGLMLNSVPSISRHDQPTGALIPQSDSDSCANAFRPVPGVATSSANTTKSRCGIWVVIPAQLRKNLNDILIHVIRYSYKHTYDSRQLSDVVS